VCWVNATVSPSAVGEPSVSAKILPLGSAWNQPGLSEPDQLVGKVFA